MNNKNQRLKKIENGYSDLEIMIRDKEKEIADIVNQKEKEIDNLTSQSEKEINHLSKLVETLQNDLNFKNTKLKKAEQYEIIIHDREKEVGDLASKLGELGI